MSKTIEEQLDACIIPGFQIDPELPVPFGKSILVDQILQNDSQKTVGGIIIPDTVEAKSNAGIVIAIGPMVNNGVKPGMKILFNSYANNQIVLNGKNYLLMYETDVYAAVPPKSIVMQDDQDEINKRRDENIEKEGKRLKDLMEKDENLKNITEDLMKGKK